MQYLIVLVIFGAAALGMAWMPMLSAKLRISYALIYMLLGILLFTLFPVLPHPDPVRYPVFTVHITELVVLVALMGSGLKIDQPFSLKTWKIPLRLVSLGMIAYVAAMAFLAWKFIGMDLGSAIILAAVLCPTDPVLASDVQVGPPHEGEKEIVQFSLTAEGGMNDGTAFPFVWLGILMTTGFFVGAGSWVEWTGFYLLYKIASALICGFLLGKAAGFLLFSLPEKYRLVKIEDGFVALSMTLLVYGITELIKGYGFIAVFTCAVALRNYEMGHRLHRTLHAFSDQIERMLVAIVLLLFGGSLVHGLLSHLTWKLALLGIVFLVIVRPLITWLVLSKTRMYSRERAIISLFGVRGIGSFFYMSFAAEQTSLTWLKPMWSTVAFVVLLSVIVHGLSATTVINKLESYLRKKKPRNRIHPNAGIKGAG